MGEVQNILSQLGGLHAELAVRLPFVNLHQAIFEPTSNTRRRIRATYMIHLINLLRDVW